MATRQTLGFIGLGLMGTPMAVNLCKSGADIVVWNRTPEKAEPVVAAGARAAATKAELARDADVVFLCVFDTDAVAEVLFAEDGIATAMRPGTTIVDHSTIDPGAAIQCADRLAREFDIGFVDAPVTGGVIGAEAAALTIFGGGESAVVERVRPLVMHMAKRFEHLGESGAGQSAKVCNQIMVQTTIAALAEMIKLAEANRIDVDLLLELLQGGMASSRVLEVMGPFMSVRSDHLNGPLEVAVKDLDIIRAAGKKFGVALPMSSTANELYRMAAAKGFGKADNSQVIRIYD